MTKRYELDRYKNEIVDLYINNKFSCKHIADIYGYSLCGIYDALKRWNIDTRNLSDSHRIYSCNEEFFHKVDSEEKAYWLGFIYADGYITGDNLDIALSSRDENHLIKFKQSIASNSPVNKYMSQTKYRSIEYSRILIRSNKLVQDIKAKGVLNNKSLILKFPNKDILDCKLYSHFIRGYFDGDGTLVLSKNSINFKICGTKELLNSMIEIFNKVSSYDFDERLFKRWNDEKNNYYLSYGGRYKTLSIMNYLYSDSQIHLDRKYNKFINLRDMK